MLASLFLLSCSGGKPPQARVESGVLDLRSWDFQKYPALQLEGEWEFFPALLLDGDSLGFFRPDMRLRTVPDLWRGDDAGGEKGQGAGTYHLKILLPAKHPELAIRYRTVSTSFELDANGKRLASVGKPRLDRRAAVAAYRPGVVALPDEGEVLDLVVRVSNHDYRVGGMWRSFNLGEKDRLFHDKRVADITVYCQASVILVIALNALIFFLFRPKEKAYLFFALFGISIVFRVLVTGEYLFANIVPTISFDLLVRLEYLTVALPIPLAALSFSALFSDERKSLLTFLICLPFVLRIVFGLSLVPLPLLTRSIFVFYPLAVLSIFALLLGIILPAIRHKRQGSLTILLAASVLFLCFVNDSLFSSFLVNTSNWLGFGLIAFMVLQSGVLTRRFSLAFDRGEALQEELALANSRLAEENELYRKAETRLKAALEEKDMLLREVHHRVKNSLQIVSSGLALQAHRSEDPLALEIYSSVRNRIRAISLVHEKLYGLDSAEHMDLGGYIRELVLQLSGGYDSRTGRVDLAIEADHVEAHMDVCVDFGLLVTELVANAYKHAILPRGGGLLGISLKREGETIVFRVEDEGPSFPLDFKPQGTHSLGFKIITSLARKYKGSLSLPRGSGAVVEIRFPRAALEFGNHDERDDADQAKETRT